MPGMPGMPGMPPAPGTVQPVDGGRTIEGEATPVQKFDYHNFEGSENSKLNEII